MYLCLCASVHLCICASVHLCICVCLCVYSIHIIRMTGEGTFGLQQLLQNLKELHLGSTAIASSDAWQALFTALEAHTCLHTLNLSHNTMTLADWYGSVVCIVCTLAFCHVTEVCCCYIVDEPNLTTKQNTHLTHSCLFIMCMWMMFRNRLCAVLGRMPYIHTVVLDFVKLSDVVTVIILPPYTHFPHPSLSSYLHHHLIHSHVFFAFSFFWLAVCDVFCACAYVCI
jgi:hypothetical protein